MSAKSIFHATAPSPIKLFSCSGLICLSLIGCGQKPAEPGPAAVQSSDTSGQAERKSIVNGRFAAISSDDLNKLAITAFREQRLYAPAADNALEYYLALRQRSEIPDPRIESALNDLAPYSVIAAEQAISRRQYDEASRLRDLIAAIDPTAPSLPRIRQAIIDNMKNDEAVAAAKTTSAQPTLLAVESDPMQIRRDTLNVIAAGNADKAAPPPMTTAEEASSPVAQTSAASSRKTLPETTAAMALHLRTPPEQAPGSKTGLVAIRTPYPDFPADALNRGLSGDVEIEFIVQTSGEVSGVRVIHSNQRVFDRHVLMTVKRWKFAPLDEAMTVRRSFNFKNPS